MTPEKIVAEIDFYHTITLIFSQPQEVVNIFHITHIRDLVRAGESNRRAFIDRTEYYNLSRWFV